MLTRTWLLTLFAFAVLASFELYMLDVRAPDRLAMHGQHAIPLYEFGAQAPIAQTFAPRVDGLHQIRLRVSARAQAQGTLDWSLFEADGNGGWAKVVSAQRPIRLAAGEGWHTLQFPEVERSAGRLFRLMLRLSEAREGVALIASKDDAHAAGELTVGGQERWGDLSSRRGRQATRRLAASCHAWQPGCRARCAPSGRGLRSSLCSTR